MNHKSNSTSKLPLSWDSNQTPNNANLVPQNPLQVAAQPKSTLMNAFCQNIEIDPMDPDQTIATPEEVSSNAITAERTFLAMLSGRETSRIDFYADKSLEDQVAEAKQHVNMTRALMDITEQGNLPKRQPSQVIHLVYNNQMLKQLRALLQTEGAYSTSVYMLLTRIVVIMREPDQEIKKLTGQQVIELIMIKQMQILLERTQDFARKPTHKTLLNAFLPHLSQLQQQSMNPYASIYPFYNQLPQQQIQEQQSLQYLFQYTGQPAQYPIQRTQFPTIPLLNPFLPMEDPPYKQTNEHRLLTNLNSRSYQNLKQPIQKLEQTAAQIVERPKQNETGIDIQTIFQFFQCRHTRYNKLPDYHCYIIQQRERERNSRDRAKDQYSLHIREQMSLKKLISQMKQYLKQQCHTYHRTRVIQKQLNEHDKIEDTIWQEIPV
ncbi:MAG: hypothetical protein EZS28_001425 [Streblomastix strix]|uniref:Uncharacterized protein n=1 Tax=Streblomastix strix TaxID=222440 RepID=A0A5J4X8F3_9EUKA|nr:MAG: hypothetical protein EZS28_001425 [Streblomastix strix]